MNIVCLGLYQQLIQNLRQPRKCGGKHYRQIVPIIVQATQTRNSNFIERQWQKDVGGRLQKSNYERPVIVRERLFREGRDIQRLIRYIKERYSRPPQNVVQAAEKEFIQCLFFRHPRAVQKGVIQTQQISVQKSEEYDTQCFWITTEKEDSNLESQDISYIKCLDGRVENDYTRFFQACLNSVRPNLILYRDENFYSGIPCSLSSQLILDVESATIEHNILPLELLMLEYMKEQKLELSALEYKIIPEPEEDYTLKTVQETNAVKVPHPGYCFNNYGFTDEGLEERVREYHKQNSALRFIHKNAYYYQPQHFNARKHVYKQKRNETSTDDKFT